MHAAGACADEIAYLIYTSGTTGAEGVAIAHRNVTWLVARWTPACPGSGVDAMPFVGLRLLRLGDLGALLSGRRLVVVPEEVAYHPEDFHDPAGRRAGQRSDADPSAVAMLPPSTSSR